MPPSTPSPEVVRQRLFRALFDQVSSGSHLQNALITVDKLLRLDPHDTFVRTIKAQVLLNLNKSTLAAIVLSQDDEDLVTLRAACFLKMGLSDTIGSAVLGDRDESEEDKALKAALLSRENPRRALDLCEELEDDKYEPLRRAVAKRAEFIANIPSVVQSEPDRSLSLEDQPIGHFFAPKPSQVKPLDISPKSTSAPKHPKRLPKNVKEWDPNARVDPERWLPKSQRTTQPQKPVKRKQKPVNLKESQGLMA